MTHENDPVAEVHEARDLILTKAGTLDALLDSLIQRQSEKPDQIVSRPAVPAHIRVAA